MLISNTCDSVNNRPVTHAGQTKNDRQVEVKSHRARQREHSKLNEGKKKEIKIRKEDERKKARE